MINWRRIIATGTVAGMIAVTGCSTTIPETRSAERVESSVNRTSDRNVNRGFTCNTRRNATRNATRNTTRRAYGSYANVAGHHRDTVTGNEIIGWSTARTARRNSTNSLNIGRPQGRIGTAFRNPNSAPNRAANSFDRGRVTTESAVDNTVNNRVDNRVVRTRPASNAVTRSTTTRSTATRSRNLTANRKVSVNTGVDYNIVTGSNGLRTAVVTAKKAVPTRTARSTPVRNTPNRSTTVRSTPTPKEAPIAPETLAPVKNERVHIIPHDVAMDALRNNTQPAQVAAIAENAETAHRNSVDAKHRRNARRTSQTTRKVNRAGVKTNSHREVAAQRKNNRYNLNLHPAAQTVSLMNQYDLAFFKRKSETPATEPNQTPPPETSPESSIENYTAVPQPTPATTPARPTERVMK